MSPPHGSGPGTEVVDEASGARARTAAIAANIERYTVRPGPRVNGDVEPAHVVVTLLDADLTSAFERARELARAHGAARLVAHGAALASTWPSWVRSEPGLVLTEIGAYRAENPFEATDHLRSSYRAWIDDVFATAAPAGAAADIYFAPVVVRLFHAAFETQTFAGGIAAVHRDAQIHLVGEDRRVFEDILELRSGSFTTRAREAAVPPLVAAAWAASLAFTVVECVRMRVDARRSFEAIDAAAARRSEDEKPSLWAGLVPDWERMNHHLLDAGVMPAIRKGERIGVLLLGTLRSGNRNEQNLKAVENRAELWPALGELRTELGRCEVAQAVQPRSTLAYVRGVGAAVRSSIGVGVRMVTRPGPLQALARGGGVWTIARRAAAAGTLDVARSILAERAAREFVRDRDVAGHVVAFNASNGAGYTSVEWVLRRAGAITLEHTHGSGGNAFYGASEATTLIQCVWTKPDADVFPARRKVLVAGMPQVLELKKRTPTVPRRILLLTNYVHRDRPYRALPFEPFQDEMLRIPKLLREAMGDVFEFRWRPHPADEDVAVARGHARVPGLALSRNRTLREDLDECDVLFSGQSTALVEAVVSDVPFFVHITPEWENEMAWAPTERRFFRAEEAVAPFASWVAAVKRGDPSAGEATVRARQALFGPSGKPVPLHDAITALTRTRDPELPLFL